MKTRKVPKLADLTYARTLVIESTREYIRSMDHIVPTFQITENLNWRTRPILGMTGYNQIAQLIYNLSIEKLHTWG